MLARNLTRIGTHEIFAGSHIADCDCSYLRRPLPNISRICWSCIRPCYGWVWVKGAGLEKFLFCIFDRPSLIRLMIFYPPISDCFGNKQKQNFLGFCSSNKVLHIPDLSHNMKGFLKHGNIGISVLGTNAMLFQLTYAPLYKCSFVFINKSALIRIMFYQYDAAARACWWTKV